MWLQRLNGWLKLDTDLWPCLQRLSGRMVLRRGLLGVLPRREAELRRWLLVQLKRQLRNGLRRGLGVELQRGLGLRREMELQCGMLGLRVT